MTTEEKIDSKLKDLTADVKAHTRRTADLERQIDILNQDRQILEDLVTSTHSVEDALRIFRDHLDDLFKAVKLEVQVQGERTQKEVVEVKETMEASVQDKQDKQDKKIPAMLKKAKEIKDTAKTTGAFYLIKSILGRF